MQATQVSSLMDTCVRCVFSEAADAAGQMIPTWTDGVTLACGFEPRSSIEARRPDMTVLSYDARLRLAITATMDYRDKIRLTHRYGALLATPLTFAIEGQPLRGPSGLVLLLKAVSE
jgi:head-tail adaptor